MKDSPAYKLKELLTDENYFMEFKQDVISTDRWENIKCVYGRTVCELSGKREYNVLTVYNKWLMQHKTSVCCDLEFGCAIRDGKRVYALLKRNEAKNGRRRVVMYSACIADLIQYLIATHEVN